MTGNYAESNVVGVQWKRANAVYIYNPYGGAGRVIVQEEEMTHLGDKIVTQPSDTLRIDFDPEGSFPEINPETGEVTGNTVSHMQVYVALHSLYIHLAKQRDEAALHPTEEELIAEMEALK
jgi:hypothetical protein